MLRAHIIVVEAIGFLPGESQNLLRAWCEVIHHVNVGLSAFALDSLSFARMNFQRKGSAHNSAKFMPQRGSD